MTDPDTEPADPNSEPDFPAKIADTLESVADKARSLTVGRAEDFAKWTAAGTILAFVGVMAVIFLLIGVSRVLGELVGTETGYAIIGGLFLVVAWLVWRKRDPKETPDA